jgi:hypothetical protein
VPEWNVISTWDSTACQPTYNSHVSNLEGKEKHTFGFGVCRKREREREPSTVVVS